MKKNYKIILFILLTIYYFEYSVSITWDSAHYLGYVKILEGITPFSSWDVVRGPVFPIIIYTSNFLFGKTNQGLIILTYLYYLLMLIFISKIIDYFCKNISLNNKIKRITKIIIVLLIIIDPIIFGYYHSLLTEFVAITLSIISCYYATIWLDTNCNNEKRKYMYISVLFIFLTLFSWFLKQPYVSCGLFSILIAYIISIFQNRKEIIPRTITIISCILFLFIVIKVWNIILNSNGNDTSTTRNPTNALGNQLVKAPDYIDINNNKEIYNKDFLNESKLSKQEKKDINILTKHHKKYILVYVYNNDKLVDVDYIKSTNGMTITITSSMGYLLSSFIENPIKLSNSYITNYFSIIDIYSTITDDGVHYESKKKFDLNFSNEITSIGIKPFLVNETNTFPLSNELYENSKNYISINNTNTPLNKLLKYIFKVCILIFKIIFFLLPISFITTIVLRINKNYKKYSNSLNLTIILLGYSLLHLLLHTVTGAIVDRYAIPAFLPTFIATIMLLIIIYDKNRKKKVNKKLMHK